MKEKYTIGEVASFLNMSPQMLRFYDRSGVVVPHYINQKTGYRYYSYDQIPYIDRVKYLQQFGFRLEEIKDALESNNMDTFKTALLRRQQELRQELDRLTNLQEDLDWYIDYFSHIDYHSYNDLPFKVREPERYLLTVPISAEDRIYGSAGPRLLQLQHDPQFADVRFLRQNAYVLDAAALLEGKLQPTHYAIYLKQMPPLPHPNLLVVPAGTYFCVQARILAEPFDGSVLQRYFRDRQAPRLALANEYEDNFTSFKDCVYEIQIQEKP